MRPGARAGRPCLAVDSAVRRRLPTGGRDARRVTVGPGRCDIVPMAIECSPPSAWADLHVWSRHGVVIALALAVGVAWAESPAGSAQSLRSAWSRLEAQGDAPPVPAPAVASSVASGTLTGSLHGVLETDFGALARALGDPGAWCEVLILDPNVHRCLTSAASASPATARISVAFGESGSPVDLGFAHMAESDYLLVSLTAAEGPFGTRDYAMTLEAAVIADALELGLGWSTPALGVQLTAFRNQVDQLIITRLIGVVAGRTTYVFENTDHATLHQALTEMTGNSPDFFENELAVLDFSHAQDLPETADWAGIVVDGGSPGVGVDRHRRAARLLRPCIAQFGGDASGPRAFSHEGAGRVREECLDIAGRG